MSEIPSVKVLNAIGPSNSGTGEAVLSYSGLTSAVDRYNLTSQARWNAVWDSEVGSLDEYDKAEQVAKENLLRTSEKVVGASLESRDLWSDRFTLGASELYGVPEKDEVAKLVSQEYGYLLRLRGNTDVSLTHIQFLLDTYWPIFAANGVVEDYHSNPEARQEKTAVREYGEVIKEAYQPLFDLVDRAGKKEFTPQDLHSLFTDALGWLAANDDQDWAEWKLVFSDTTQLTVDPINKTIKIGSRRQTASWKETRGLVAHELLTHGLRAKNGWKTGEKDLATGLSGYADAEEGLGILSEEAVNGELPDKAYDRYVDIALALGTVDGRQRTRQETFRISYSRQLVRAQLRGDSAERLASLPGRVWAHVDRIYRGGLGDSVGIRQAIFTKDIAYYVGYKKMAKYIAVQMAAGRSAQEIFSHLSQGKFDPTNSDHLKKLAEVTA